MGICAVCYMWNVLGVLDLWLIGGWYIWHGYMCILLYMKLLGFNIVAWIYGQFGGLDPSAMGICAFCYTWNLLGVTVLHGSMLNLGDGSICHGYICILLYVKLIGYSVANLLGVMCKCSMDLWSIWGVHQPWVYVNSAIWEMYWVYWCSIDLWSIGGGPSAMGICASCYIWNFLGLSV